MVCQDCGAEIRVEEECIPCPECDGTGKDAIGFCPFCHGGETWRQYFECDCVEPEGWEERAFDDSTEAARIPGSTSRSVAGHK